MRNSHKSELDTLDDKDSVFVFDKTCKNHDGAGNYGNYVCDYNNDIIVQLRAPPDIIKNCPTTEPDSKNL